MARAKSKRMSGSRTYSTMVQLQRGLENACRLAIEDTATELKEKLDLFIVEEYYDKYPNPISYVRTDTFKESAVAEMINDATASVGISDDYLSYNYPAQYGNPDGTKGHWTGEDQVYMADAGYHGNVSIYRDGHFFKAFTEYCGQNAIEILKRNLRKYGLSDK